MAKHSDVFINVLNTKNTKKQMHLELTKMMF